MVGQGSPGIAIRSPSCEQSKYGDELSQIVRGDDKCTPVSRSVPNRPRALFSSSQNWGTSGEQLKEIA